MPTIPHSRLKCLRIALSVFLKTLSPLPGTGHVMNEGMTDDLALLRAYANDGAEDAFQTVVERHLGLVHSAALRQVGDPYLAQEVTQAVFLILAPKAGWVGCATEVG